MNTTAAIVLAASIGFMAPDDGGVWQLWLVETQGAVRQVTHGDTDLVWLSRSADDGSFAASRADGKVIVFGHDLREVETVDLGDGASQAALSPDGTRIAFIRTTGPAKAPERDIEIYDRQKGRAFSFLRRPGLQRAPTWTRDGTAIVFTEGRPKTGEALWRRSIDGSSEEQLTVGNHFDFEPSVSGDGTVYFSSNRNGNYDIYRIGATQAKPEVVVRAPGYDGVPRVSDDGGQIVFVSDRSGKRRLWVAAADGTDPVMLPTPGPNVRFPIWLASSRRLRPEAGWIAHLRVGADGRWQPWAMRTDGAELRKIADLPKDPSRISVTADGSRLLANASDGTIYLVEMASGTFDEISVEPAGSTDAAISPDGRSLTYSASTMGGIDTNDIWVAPVNGGRARKLTEQNYMQHFPCWIPGGDLLYLSGRGGQVHDIWRVPSGGGEPREVLSGHRYNFEPTVSRSGRVAFSSNNAGDYDLYLLDDGSDAPRAIARDESYDGQASFSPSGNQLAFVSRRAGGGHIWIVDVESEAVHPLTDEGEARMPVWYAGPNHGNLAEMSE